MAIRAAIVGCGMIAGRFEDFAAADTYSHAKAYRDHGTYGELAFFDNDPLRARFLADKAGGKAYASINELLCVHRPKVVSICVPDDLHYQYVETLLQSKDAPKLIFVEKPVCASRGELAALLRLKSDDAPALIVNHSRRFDPAHQRVKALIAGGELGPLVNVHVDYYGGWRHLGVHVVDTLQYFFDADLVLTGLEYVCPSKYADDPTLNVQGRIGSARVRLDGHLEEHYQILDMNLMCERGQVKLTDFGKRIEVLRKTVNAEQERVLETDPNCSGRGMQSPICAAVDLIARYVNCGDRDLLLPYGLDEAGRTMNTIWTGMETYATQS